MSRVSFITASSKEEMWAWYGCAHTMASPNAISSLMVPLGYSRRNAKSLQNSPASPQTPTWERVESSGWVTSVIWNCVKGGQILWLLQSTWEDSSHQQYLWQSMHNCSSLIVSANKENQLVGRWWQANTWGRCQLRHLDVFPQVLSASEKCPDVG